jgi:hypothetical protein
VYFHRDDKGKIIYIGKAAMLKNRVMNYFQKGHKDPKTRLLVADIADTEWIVVGSEVEALFLESEFIKRYKPKYNIDLKDDKNFIYVKISAEEFPVVFLRAPPHGRQGPLLRPVYVHRRAPNAPCACCAKFSRTSLTPIGPTAAACSTIWACVRDQRKAQSRP